MFFSLFPPSKLKSNNKYTPHHRRSHATRNRIGHGQFQHEHTHTPHEMSVNQKMSTKYISK